jgi:hypothetical protein
MCSQNHPGAERETAKPQRQERPASTRPLDDTDQIIQLAATRIVHSGRCANATKVESQRNGTTCDETTRDRVNHFISHRTAEKRMRMTTNGDSSRLRVQVGIWKLNERFDVAGYTG